jgi:glucose-1-phosphate thymidylyltransferase
VSEVDSRNARAVWGLVPAAGQGTRIQPLAFSKELLPVGGGGEGEFERPRAISEYLLERMLAGGVDRFCFVISPAKSDILEYYGGSFRATPISYVVQSQPAGLCDALFRALPLVRPEDEVVIGLPDTLWFPEDALSTLGTDALSFLLFPVARPELFDAVVTGEEDRVLEIRVKRPERVTEWVWGAFKMSGAVLHELHELWWRRDRRDEYVGTLANAWIAAGGNARAVRAGRAYVDVGTLHGYREAIKLLAARDEQEAAGLERTP